jgi:rhodanese-related sulfurtransferase
MENQKKENRALLIGVTLILAVLAIFFLRSNLKNKKSIPLDSRNQSASTNFLTINPEDLAKIISSQEKIQLIDIRTIEEYASEHILDSINLPTMSGVEFSTIRIARDIPIVIISNTGDDESVNSTYQKITIDGYQNTSILKGGILFWKSQNFPTVTWGDPQSFVNQSKIIFLEPVNLKKQMDTGAVLYILDVRDKNEYLGSHLQRTVNIPLGELEQRRNELPLNKTIIVYGATDLQSFQAGVRLHDIGMPNNVVLKGGAEGWKQKGYPMEK